MTADVYTGPLPVATPESRPFWEAARQHRLCLPYCPACSRWHFYPRPFCPHCFGADIEWRDASGRGVLLSYVIHARAPRNFPVAAPYAVGIIELAEGPRMMSLLVEVEPTPAALACDMAVEVVFTDVTPEVTLPRFRPVASA